MHSKLRVKMFHRKCHVGRTEVPFLGRIITLNRVTPQKQKITNYLEKVKFRHSIEELQQDIGLLNYYRKYKAPLAESLSLFFQLPKTTENQDNINITPELMNEIREIIGALDECCGLAQRQP